MKSPFPGMDPYIEAFGLWGDFHTHLIEEIYRALAEAVLPKYTVRAGERSYVVLAGDDGEEVHFFLPDLALQSRPGDANAISATATAAVIVPDSEDIPLTMRPFVSKEFRESFVEIRDSEAEEPETSLVTCIEVLSPSNKRPGTTGWDLYLRKRQTHFLGMVNLVEFDLLQGGQRMPMRDRWPTSPYAILVARGGVVPRCVAWPAYFRRPLPLIPIPLRRPDPDVMLDLRPMIEDIYRRSRYYLTMDYSKPIKPPLGPDDAAWLEQQLRAPSAQPPSPDASSPPKPS